MKSTSSHSIDIANGIAVRKTALLAVTLTLTLAVGCVLIVIASSTANATNLPVFTAANALAAKQSSGIGAMATAAIAICSFGAMFFFSGNRKNN